MEHNLFEILPLTVCAVIAEADGWEDVEVFGKERLDWLMHYGEFANGISAHDTIMLVVSRINYEQF